MSPRITDEQREAIRQHPGQPVEVRDEQTGQVCFLLTADTFARVQPLLSDEPFDVRESYAAQDEALAKVWDDPELDVYNDYDSHKPQP